MKVELSQEKIEHAVLWSIVKDDYRDGFIDAEHVARKLNNYFAPSQIDVALRHLAECGLLEARHASMQEHFAPTRLSFKKVELLSANVATFVGRLNKHGATFLSSQAAKDARLDSQILPPTPLVQPSPMLPKNPSTGDEQKLVDEKLAPHVSSRETDWSKSAAIAAWIIIPITIVGIIVAIYLDHN